MDFVTKEDQLKCLPSVPLDLLRVILKDLYFFETHYDLGFDWREYYEHSKILGCNLKPGEFEGALSALQVVVSWLIKNNRENSGKFTFHNILATHSSLEEDDINELEADFDELLQTYPGYAMLKTGLQLVDVDWRAGITVATDSSSNINIPYVQLKLTFINPQTGCTSSNTLNLDYQTFAIFLKDVKKINGLLATYN